MRPADEHLLDPAEVARWLCVQETWVAEAVAEGLPVFGHRGDGTPVFAVEEVRRWLRRPDPDADTT